MTHLDLMHGRDYAGQRVTGWLVQEKFNGLRALWTGNELVSKNGERFNAPAWFTAGLPSVPLDGELYAGVGTRGRIANTLARWKSDKNEDWRGVRFMVFDDPECGGGFEWRSEAMIRTCPPQVPGDYHYEFVQTWRVESLAILRRDLKRLHARGGEGFILRDPSAPYVAGRTDKLLKFKSRTLY